MRMWCDVCLAGRRVGTAACGSRAAVRVGADASPTSRARVPHWSRALER